MAFRLIKGSPFFFFLGAGSSASVILAAGFLSPSLVPGAGGLDFSGVVVTSESVTVASVSDLGDELAEVFFAQLSLGGNPVRLLPAVRLSTLVAALGVGPEVEELEAAG